MLTGACHSAGSAAGPLAGSTSLRRGAPLGAAAATGSGAPSAQHSPVSGGHRAAAHHSPGISARRVQRQERYQTGDAVPLHSAAPMQRNPVSSQAPPAAATPGARRLQGQQSTRAAAPRRHSRRSAAPPVRNLERPRCTQRHRPQHCRDSVLQTWGPHSRYCGRDVWASRRQPPAPDA
jgi:hypothetical protein